MKTVFLALLSILILSAGSAHAETGEEAGAHKVHHLVIVWLKQAGDAQARQHYIAASKALAELPGVLSYDVGTPADIKRQRPNAALDESYDVAVSATFPSPQAFADFLKNPQYLKLAQEELRPMVDKYKVYEFVE
jgi:hypothetical protein